MQMHNPPHPGSIIKEGIQNLSMTVGEFAAHIGVSRNTLSRIINEKAGVTADMSIRISEAFGQGSSAVWLRAQNTYDLWIASQGDRVPILPLHPPPPSLTQG